MKLNRLDANPLLTPDDLAATRDDLRVLTTLNPGAVRFGDETILMVRVGEIAAETDDAVSHLRYDVESGEVIVEYISRSDSDLDLSDPRKHRYRGKTLLSSLSHLRVARSSNGRDFVFDPKPAIFPATPYEAFGCEDARITRVDGVYYIAYTAVSRRGVAVAMVTTEDFVSYKRCGLIFPPYQKDVCIFPEKVGGRYVCRHRPYKSEFNDACIWTAYSPDLVSWGCHEMSLGVIPGTWQAGRVGAGAPPVRTETGWLDIYHAADADGVYRLGAMLSDLDHPERILQRSSQAVLEPEADYELAGLFANCVFSNGMVADADGTLTVYYGAADSVCAAAVGTVDGMIAAAQQ